MLRQHAKMVAILLYAADMLVTACSFVLAYWLRRDYLARFDLKKLYPFEDYAWLLVIILPVWTVLLIRFQAYRSYRTTSFFDEHAALAKSVVIGGLIVGAISFALKTTFLSRAFIFIFIVINLGLLAAERLTVRLLSRAVRRRGYNYRNLLIVGTSELARDLSRRIMKFQEWGVRIVGFVALEDNEQRGVIEGHQVVGILSDLENIIHHNVVDEVIFAVPGGMLQELEDKLLMLEEHGVSVRLVANIFPHIIAKVQIEELETIPLLTFTTIPTDVLSLTLKRAFDIVVSVLMLVGSLPVMLAAAIAVKLNAPGPVFFRQKRCGLNGRIFMLYKFRSMYADAEERRKVLEGRNEMAGPVFKIKDDPRITPVGKFLRTTSIDELPQLWNVLKGDMSIVGPRPPIPEEVGKYERWQRRRLSMRPGLTCLWQISGRNKITDFDEWVRLDLQYIDTWSLALDLKIFLRTIPVVLFQRGAA